MELYACIEAWASIYTAKMLTQKMYSSFFTQTISTKFANKF